MKTIIEPFKIKMVEPIKLTTPNEREAMLRPPNSMPSNSRRECSSITDGQRHPCLSGETGPGISRKTDEKQVKLFRFEQVCHQGIERYSADTRVVSEPILSN